VCELDGMGGEVKVGGHVELGIDQTKLLPARLS
jgi:hypothetical protein